MKTIITALSFLFTLTALANNQTYISERVAEDILKTRGPTKAESALGKWRKVLHGPNNGNVGVLNSGGFSEGYNSTIMEIVVEKTVLPWLAPEIGTVYVASFSQFPSLNIEHRYIESNHIDLSNLGARATLAQTGEMLSFQIPLAFKYQFWNSVFGRKVYEAVSLELALSYKCALQEGNANRLICEQNIVGKAYDIDLSKWVVNQFDFPRVIAFERTN